MKMYKKPEIEVIDFECNDVIATSGGNDPTPPNPPVPTVTEVLNGIKGFEMDIFGN